MAKFNFHGNTTFINESKIRSLENFQNSYLNNSPPESLELNQNLEKLLKIIYESKELTVANIEKSVHEINKVASSKETSKKILALKNIESIIGKAKDIIVPCSKLLTTIFSSIA